MQQLLAFGRIWTTFRTARDVGARCPGLLFPKTRESGFRSFRTRMSSVLENRLKARDLIPESFVLVYRGGMDGYIHLAYATSTLIFISSVISLYSVFDADKPISFPMNMWSDRLAGLQNYTQLFIVYAALFAMILSLGSISRKYVLRMYYNDKTQTYRVVRVGFLPTAIRTHDFKAGSLHRINKRSVVPWLNMQYKHNGEKYLILDEGFRTNADYERMFRDGYA